MIDEQGVHSEYKEIRKLSFLLGQGVHHPEEAAVMLKTHIRDGMDKEAFVFKRELGRDLKKRAHDLASIVTKCIKSSKTFQIRNDDVYTYSSHCFRKTFAQNDYKKNQKRHLQRLEDCFLIVL